MSEYRRGNELPPREEGGLAYSSEDVVIPEAPQSGPIQARMTDTVAGGEGDAGIPISSASGSVGDAGAVDSSLGTADMLGTPMENASGVGVPTDKMSLNFEEIETEYTGDDREGTGGSVGSYDVHEVGEGSRDADQPGGGAPDVQAESGALAYRADDVVLPDAPESAALAHRSQDVVSESPESRPIQARMSDTVAEDDKEKSTDDGDSGDKDSGEPPAGTGPTGPLNASDAASLDGGDGMELDEVPLTLINFTPNEAEVPAVIEDTGADLGTEALPDLGELGADEDDAPPVE